MERLVEDFKSHQYIILWPVHRSNLVALRGKTTIACRPHYWVLIETNLVTLDILHGSQMC